MARTALVAGSTGLIGSTLLELLLADSHYDKIIALSRKPLGLTHPKLENVLIHIDEWAKLYNVKA
ncbi:MAG TPA: NAD-dependent epimerase/dehydratase family protein, partial [Cyclobacteriaceae bacterium]|nr:NAD-dependent epimerase/dehydratase family protein [Cyclobacteriaceae bacterium]